VSESYYIWSKLGNSERDTEIKRKTAEALVLMPWQRFEDWEKTIKGQGNDFIICFINNEPAGLVWFTPKRSDKYLLAVGAKVAPKFRGRKLSKEIIKELCYYALKNNLKGVKTFLPAEKISKFTKELITESKLYHPNKGRVKSKEAVRLFVEHPISASAIMINPEALELRKKEIKKAQAWIKKRKIRVK